MRQTVIGISGMGARSPQPPNFQGTTQHRLEMPTTQTSMTSSLTQVSLPPVTSASTPGDPIHGDISGKASNGKQPARTESPGNKGSMSSSTPPVKASDGTNKARNTKKSETRRQSSIPTSTVANEQPIATSTPLPATASSSSATTITTEGLPKTAALETAQAQEQNVSQSLQELQIDTQKTGKDMSIDQHSPSATSSENLSSVTSIPGSASPSARSTPSTRGQARLGKEQDKTSPESDDIDIENAEGPDSEATFSDHHEQDDVEEPPSTAHNCAIRDLASRWPPIINAPKPKSKLKEKKAQLTLACDKNFESSIDEITHYLEHFSMAGPYIECRDTACRMVFVLESQLEEHVAALHPTNSSSSTASPTSPNKSKSGKASSSGKGTAASTSSNTATTSSKKGSQSRVTRSQAKPDTKERSKNRKSQKDKPIKQEDLSDVPLKLLGPFKK